MGALPRRDLQLQELKALAHPLRQRIHLCPLERFTEDYVELFKKYWRPPEECPADAEPVAAVFYAFPWPGE